MELLEQTGERKDATRAQIALAWALAPKRSIVPIPGTIKLPHLEDTIEAASIEFTPEDLQRIDDALSNIEVVGARYPEELEERTGR